MDGESSLQCLDLLLISTSAVFQAGGLNVVLVEVGRKAYLASIVPVIVNAVLGEHQLVVDIVAFVSKGDFPRSRLGEKQRGKILASWVTRKLRTIAQFSIRENDGSDSQITEVGEPRAGTMAASTLGGSSLRNVETQSPPAKEHNVSDYTSLPTGISEMPAYETSIVGSPPLGITEEDREDTPTDTRHHYNDYPTPTANDHNGYTTETTTQTYTSYTSPKDDKPLPQPHPSNSTASTTPEPHPDYMTYSHSGPLADPAHGTFNFNAHDVSPDEDTPAPQARYSSKPVLSLSHERDPTYNHRLHHSSDSGDLFTLPSAQRRSSYNTPSPELQRAGQNGLAGKPSMTERQSSNETGSSGDEWRREAIRQMDFGGHRGGGAGDVGAGGYGRRRDEGQYDGSGYGHAM